jgi:putative salt-induced outer membrane protein
MKLKISLLSLVLLPFTSLAQSAEETIAKYLIAIGGEDKIASIKSFQYIRSYKANAATDFDEEVTVSMNDKKFSRKKTILERDFYYVLNGNNAWLKIPMGSRDKAPTYTTKDLNTKEKADLMLEVNDGFVPFFKFESKGYTLSGPVSKTTLDGKNSIKLAIEKTGISREYFFDQETGLLTSENWTINGIIYNLNHKKYTVTNTGIKLPTESTYMSSKDKKETKVTTIWKLENPTLGVSFIK